MMANRIVRRERVDDRLGLEQAMSAKHLRRTPHDVAPDFWWYEENAGISVCVRVGMETVVRYIPWRAIRAALARKDADLPDAPKEQP